MKYPGADSSSELWLLLISKFAADFFNQHLDTVIMFILVHSTVIIHLAALDLHLLHLQPVNLTHFSNNQSLVMIRFYILHHHVHK